jgi:hypothetical protein
MPRFQRAALYVLTSGPTSLRGNDEFAGNVSFTGNCRIIEGLRGPDLGGTDSIRVIVADLGMDWKRVRGLCRLREGDDCGRSGGASRRENGLVIIHVERP